MLQINNLRATVAAKRALKGLTVNNCGAQTLVGLSLGESLL